MRRMLPTIRNGDTGVNVRIAQLLLDAHETGVFDQAFENTVKLKQRELGIAADGIIGPNTWTALAETTPTVSTTKNRKSSYAKAVQLLLDIDADGIFGAKTKAAVKVYQQAHDMKADGIVGKQTWRAMITGVTPSDIKFVQPPDFKQYDSRWASKMYSNHGDKKQTMKSSGCGPTSMADIVAEFWNPQITPYTLAQMSMEWGTRTYNSGTSSTFFRKCHEKYGGKYQTTSSLDTARKCLTEGGLVIVCFGTGASGKAG